MPEPLNPLNPLNPLIPLDTAKIIESALANPIVPAPADVTNETGSVKYPPALTGLAVSIHV